MKVKSPLTNNILALGCVWIKDLVREKEKKRKKLEDLTVPNGWILYLFHCHFLFALEILDPNMALVNQEQAPKIQT